MRFDDFDLRHAENGIIVLRFRYPSSGKFDVVTDVGAMWVHDIVFRDLAIGIEHLRLGHLPSWVCFVCEKLCETRFDFVVIRDLSIGKCVICFGLRIDRKLCFDQIVRPYGKFAFNVRDRSILQRNLCPRYLLGR